LRPRQFAMSASMALLTPECFNVIPRREGPVIVAIGMFRLGSRAGDDTNRQRLQHGLNGGGNRIGCGDPFPDPKLRNMR